MFLKSLLYNMGLNFAWDNQNIVNHNTFLHLCYSNYFNKIVIPKHRYAFVKFVTMYKFVALMSTEHVNTICNLAAFVYSSFQRITL